MARQTRARRREMCGNRGDGADTTVRGLRGLPSSSSSVHPLRLPIVQRDLIRDQRKDSFSVWSSWIANIAWLQARWICQRQIGMFSGDGVLFIREWNPKITLFLLLVTFFIFFFGFSFVLVLLALFQQLSFFFDNLSEIFSPIWCGPLNRNGLKVQAIKNSGEKKGRVTQRVK